MEPRIDGAFCAMMTPFGQDGKLDRAIAEAMVQFFIDKGLDGIFTVSNVGEFAAMTPAEKMELTELCCTAAKGKLTVCPGVTDFDYAGTMRLAQHALRYGADAVVLSAPVYYPYSQKYVESFLTGFLDESPLPVLFYHSPQFAQPVSFEFLLGVMAHPNVVAVKESSGDAMLLLRLLEDRRSRDIATPVMLGFEELALTGLVHGAQGSITSCGGIVPELMQGIVRRFRTGDIAGAAAMQQSVCRITDIIKPYGFPIGYKIAMKARGFDMRIVKTGLDELEAEYDAAVPKLRGIIEQELARYHIEI